MNVNRYQFDSIISKTKKEISPIRRGEETGIYFEYLALMEINMYQFHLQYAINGRQAKEILQAVLYDIKGIADQQEYNYSKWMEESYQDCIETIEGLFLPQKNPALKQCLLENTELNDDYFEFPRKLIIRIYESVEQWTTDFGSEGYFNFIAGYIGTEIQTNKKYLVDNKYLS